MTEDNEGGERADVAGTARDAFLGYVYQADVALLELTRRRVESANPEWALTIEVFDDVAFQRGSEPPEVFLQSKGSLKSVRPVTDRSPELWKTLRNWATLVSEGHADPRAASFTLWTTQAAGAGSAVALLGQTERDPARAHERLVVAARTSDNAANQPAYEAFLALPQRGRQALVSAITVVSGSPSVANIDRELRKLLYSGASPNRLDAFVRRFREWWYGRVRIHLLGQDAGEIQSIEIDRALRDLREQLIGESLPLDVKSDDPRLDELTVEDRKFVHQLTLITLRDQALANAIRDYKQAFLQRHLWLQDELLALDRLVEYEDELVREWEHHKALYGEVDEGATDDEMIEAGLGLYKRVQALEIPIHESRRNRFISRGSYHMLADEVRVGWHPDFVARLQALLVTDS